MTKLKEEIKEFDQFRARINEQITLASKYSNHFYPNPEALDLLEQGKRRIEKLSARKVELEELLRDPERERKEQLRREEEERERQRRSEFIARLNSISV